MKSVFAPLAAVALFATRALAQLTINTPTNPVVCQPILLTWSGGSGPYFVSVLPGSQPSAPALQDFGSQDGTSLTWVVNIPAGTSIGLTVRDSTGTTASSAPFTINSGPDTSCIGGSSSSGGSSSATGSTSGATGGASSGATSGTSSATSPGPRPTSTSGPTSNPLTTPATTPTPTTPTTNTSSRASSSTAGNSSSSANAAPTQAAHVGAAGMIGAAVIALLA